METVDPVAGIILSDSFSAAKAVADCLVINRWRGDAPFPTRRSSDLTRSWLLAAAGLASPSSATKTAAQEQYSDETTVRLLLPAGRDAFPCRLLITHHSVTALATEKESEKTMPATGSIASTDPWR